MEFGLWKQVLVLGILQAGLYGLLPIAIVLSYRISRTIAFVHGGIALAGALAYRVMSQGTGTFLDIDKQPVHPRIAILLVVVMGAVLGAAYGAVVMSRTVSALPGITLTVISLGTMLLTIALFARLLQPGGLSVAPTPFTGEGKMVGGYFVNGHRAATFLIVVVLVTLLAVILNTTYTGLSIRAIADDLEASIWCGAKLRLIGTGVYGVSGAVAGLAGSLYCATVAAGLESMLQLFMTGLILAVVGGLRSVPLALLGALVYGILETALLVDFFGAMKGGVEELIKDVTLFLIILYVARTRKESFFLLGRPSL
jgi:branched-chain amino acid transport system permease protein